MIERITRSLAFMLRHQPEQFDLEVDAYGYADVGEVVRALNERLGEPIEEEDLVEAVESGDRVRYEIENGKIRALYGHSIPVEPGPAATPPETLFVAIAERDLEQAQRFGLRGGRRRFLHLALSEDDARESGRRAARVYTVLSIRALDAWEEGVNFYDRRSLWLAEEVPTHLLDVVETYDDGSERPPAGRGRGRRPEGGRSDDRRGRRGGGGGGGGRGRRGGRRDDERRRRDEDREERPRERAEESRSFGAGSESNGREERGRGRRDRDERGRERGGRERGGRDRGERGGRRERPDRERRDRSDRGDERRSPERRPERAPRVREEREESVQPRTRPAAERSEGRPGGGSGPGFGAGLDELVAPRKRRPEPEPRAEPEATPEPAPQPAPEPSPSRPAAEEDGPAFGAGL